MENDMKNELVFPLIIPSYEPDERLLELLEKISKTDIAPVIVINDGSGSEYDEIFNKVREDYGVTLLVHEVNDGKGKALKTAFEYCIKTYENLKGCVTADSDGQHTPEAIIRIREEFLKNSDALVLGVRDFSGEDIPPKSQFGNNLTRKVFRTLYRKDITDTQTGLRGISKAFMEELLNEPTNRFEFEMKMLIMAVSQKMEIIELPIETIYDSKENHQTHFHPVKDSIKIYSVFLGAFFKFIISSLSSSLIDLTLFQIFCILLRGGRISLDYVIVSTVCARIISAIYNYLMNYFFVFKSKKSYGKSAFKYVCLAVVQMALSAVITSGLINLLNVSIELLVKIPVDVILFLISYRVQKKYIY
mgnify:CR=1 FL=1